MKPFFEQNDKRLLGLMNDGDLFELREFWLTFAF